MTDHTDKCKNYSCPYYCQFGFCGIDIKECSFELLENREGTIIHPTAYVRPNTIVNKKVVISEMACIGSRGMTLKRDKTNKVLWRRKGEDYPVILQKGCYIGARSIIMAGTKWNTVIGKNTFIGPNVSIGHDAKIGTSCIILSGTVICGSTIINDGCYIAPSSTIKDNLVIGRNSLIGIGSLVLDDIPNNSVVYGHPAKVVRKNK